MLLTHAHVDHAFAAGEFAGDDVPVFVHEADAVAFDDLEAWNPGFDNPLAEVKDLRRLVGGEELAFEAFSIRVRHTPGHTPGHCSFLTDALLAAGDLVFAGSIGRSDFPNSSPHDMEGSLRWFLTLDDALEVLPDTARRPRWGASGDEPVPGGALMDRSRPEERSTCSLPTGRGCGRCTTARPRSPGCTATATSRRRSSKPPSCSPGPLAARATSSPRRCTRSRIDGGGSPSGRRARRP